MKLSTVGRNNFRGTSGPHRRPASRPSIARGPVRVQASFLDEIKSALIQPFLEQQERQKKLEEELKKEEEKEEVMNPLVLELLDVVARTNRGLDATAEDRAEIDRIIGLLKNPEGQVNTDPRVLTGTWKLLYTTERETLFIIQNSYFFGQKVDEIFQIIDVQGRSLRNMITFHPLPKEPIYAGSVRIKEVQAPAIAPPSHAPLDAPPPADDGSAPMDIPQQSRSQLVDNGAEDDEFASPKEPEQEGSFQVASSLRVTTEKRCVFEFKAAYLVTPGKKTWKLPPYGKGFFDNIYVDSRIRISKDSRGDLLICERY